MTVRNTGETSLRNCRVTINNGDFSQEQRAREQGNPEDRTVTVSILHPAESVEVPLSTFADYRNGSIFHGELAPWVAVACWDRDNGQWAFSNTELPIAQ